MSRRDSNSSRSYMSAQCFRASISSHFRGSFGSGSEQVAITAFERSTALADAAEVPWSGLPRSDWRRRHRGRCADPALAITTFKRAVDEMRGILLRDQIPAGMIVSSSQVSRAARLAAATFLVAPSELSDLRAWPTR